MGTKKRALAGLVAIIVVGVAGMALAAPQAGRGGGPVFPRAGLVKDLDLTEEQLAAIRGIEAECFEKTQALEASLNTKMFELRQLQMQRDPDEDAIEAKRAEIGELQEQLRAIQKESQEQVKGVYTQEQLDKVNEMKPAGPGMGVFGPGWKGRMKGMVTPGAEGTVTN